MTRCHHSRMIGFEELGNQDQFDTATLEWRLLNCGTSRYHYVSFKYLNKSDAGVIQKEAQVQSGITYRSTVPVRQKIRRNQDDDGDSDFDLDD